MKFLKLIGFEYLLLLAFAQFTIKFGFLNHQPGITLTLNDMQYYLLVLASVMIGAGGFMITNITAHGHEKYNLSEAAAYYIYGGLTIGGLAIGYYLTDVIGRTSFLMAFAIPVATLYFYSTNLRQSLLLGNIAIAIVAILSIIIVGFFAVYPVLGNGDPVRLATIFEVIRDYSVFAGLLALLLSLVYDLKNTDSDYNEGLSTLPISIGKERAAKVTFAVGLLAAGLIIYYINAYLKELLWAMGFVILLVLGPLVYFLITIWTAKTKKEFKTLEIVIKFVMLFTILSLVAITFNIINHA